MENFLRSDEDGPARSMERIATACEGLFLVSETDAPVEPITLPGMKRISPGGLLKFLDREEGEPVETAHASEFFDRLTGPEEWHGDAEKELARRFGLLRDVLESELEDLREYRIGEVRVDILILGRTRGGTIAGVRTYAIET